MVRLTGKTYVKYLCGFIGLWSIPVYFSMVQPMIDPEPYKKNRERIEQRRRIAKEIRAKEEAET